MLCSCSPGMFKTRHRAHVLKYDIIHKIRNTQTGSTQHIGSSSWQDRATATDNMHTNLMKFNQVVSEKCEWTDKKNKQTLATHGSTENDGPISDFTACAVVACSRQHSSEQLKAGMVC